MVLYFVEIKDNVTSTKLHMKVHDKAEIQYQGILGNYRTERDNRVALFVVDQENMLNFKILFPESSIVIPKGIPEEVYNYFCN